MEVKKHTESHSVKTKYCHYFNNNLPCPYENIGCKFKHEVSPQCKFESLCNSNLCQFRHSALKAFSFRNDSTETDDFASDVDGSENENSDWE